MPDQVRVGPHNVPAQLTPLIGREKELQAVITLLRQPGVRLVTLTGTGGVGKTRLGLQVATDMLDDFVEGVYFVPLASISDAGLVVNTINRVLGVKETGDLPPFDLLKSYIQDRHLLLLLDNFEQVLPAGWNCQTSFTCQRAKYSLSTRQCHFFCKGPRLLNPTSR